MNPNPADNLFPEPNTELDNSDRRTADWDIRNAPKNYLWLVLAQGSTAVFSFSSVWLIIRSLGSEGYGEIVVFIAASYIIQIFVNWSSFALPRFGVEEFVSTGKITKTFWSRTSILLPNLIGLLAAAYFFLGPLGEWLKIPPSGLWLVAIHFSTTSIWLHVQYALQGVKYLRLQGILLAVERGLTLAGLVILIFIDQVSFTNFLWCYILPSVALSAVGMFLLLPFIQLKSFYDSKWFRRVLLYSLPLIPFALVGYLSTSQLDAVFITQFLSKSDLGIYSVATQISGITLQLPILANSILLSMFVSLKSTGKDSMVLKYFDDILPSLTIFWGILCMLLAGTAGLLVPVVFGQGFEAVVSPLLILFLGIAISAPAMFGYAIYSHAISATYISTVASVLAAITNLCLNLWLIPKFGMIGCAMATFFSLAASCFTVVVLCHSKVRSSILNLITSVLPVSIAFFTFLVFFSVAKALIAFVVAAVLVCAVQRRSIRISLEFITKKLFQTGAQI